MEIIYSHVAGIDVHKKTVVVCCRHAGNNVEDSRSTRTFGTTTYDLLALSDWLTSQGVTHVAMESTGEFWKPLYKGLEGNFTILVVNAQHIKNVPGRKTDVKDAEWIAELLGHGLLRGSFIPPLPQRDLRDLTRQRTLLVQERASVVNRLQKVLEWANLKLASVASNVVGVSARAMLEAIVDGQSDVTALAELARGRLRTKRAELERALEGRVREHHRFLIARHLIHIDFLDEQIADFDDHIGKNIEATTPLAQEATPMAMGVHSTSDGGERASDTVLSSATPLTWTEAVEIWDSIPGIGERAAEQLVAEIGTDMSRFPSAGHLGRWARLAPGNQESAGKRYSSSIGPGNRWLRSTLIQVAHAAVRVKGSHLATFYRRLVARRGVKRAIVAVAHKILRIGYTLLCRRETYREQGEALVDERRKDQLLKRMCNQIERLGYSVSLEPQAAIAV
jgi:transposase